MVQSLGRAKLGIIDGDTEIEGIAEGREDGIVVIVGATLGDSVGKEDGVSEGLEEGLTEGRSKIFLFN